MTKYNVLSDMQLWDLLKSGNRNAYAEIYERYFALMYLHARTRLKNVEEAQDVVQELFVDLWELSETVTLKTSLQNYLFTSTRNRILNLITRKKIEERYRSSICLDVSYESVTDHLVREGLFNKLIQKEIDALPSKMRKVFLMSRYEHMTYMEISHQLDITEQSVRSHVKNALKVLRFKLGILFYILILFY